MHRGRDRSSAAGPRESARRLRLLAPGGVRARDARHARHGRRTRDGQSLVEFALILPVLLLLTLIAVDFGRVYLGWINLQNMTRIAANFAANHSTAWVQTDTQSLTARTKYDNQVVSDASATNCQLNPTTPAPPTFSDTNGDGVATSPGDHAAVTLTCRFAVITPVISSILGGSVAVTASSVFPIKDGLEGTVAGEAWSCQVPTAAITADPADGMAPLTVHFTDASGGGAADTWFWQFLKPDGTTLSTSNLRDPGDVVFASSGEYLVKLTVTNVCGSTTTDPGTTVTVTEATPRLCTVPNFVQARVHVNDAQALWTAAGFSTAVEQAAGHSKGNYVITFQSITAGNHVACDSPITVNG